MSRPDDTRYFDEIGHLWPYDIVFDPEQRRHLWTEGDRATFRVMTEPGFDQVMLVRRQDGVVTGDPMSWWASDGRYDYWSVTVPGDQAFDFSLALTRGSEVVYVTNAGIAGAVERLDRWTYEPGRAVAEVPEWTKGSVVYQIFPERFANGDPSLTPQPSAEWGSPPDNYRFQGGDLIGVRQRLDHVQSLGVRCIYLNPVFWGPSTHNYDAIDVRTVDPGFGGNQALAELVTAAHDRSMRVILDVSFNHVHPRFFAFEDVRLNGVDSPFNDWFVVHDHPVRVLYRPHLEVTDRYRWYLERLESLTGLPVEVVSDDGPPAEPTYDAWYGVPTMPRVNLQNREARAYFLDTARFWLEEYDIDGYRMDVTRYVEPDFWDDFRLACRSIKADAYLLCEIFGDASPWLNGARFDATMNYTFRQLAVDFFASRTVDAVALARGIVRLLAMYANPFTQANQNLLGSHDVPRFLTVADGDPVSLRLASVLQFTLPGTVGLYYGDEVGMQGGDDPDQRGAFPWHDEDSWLTCQLEAVQQLGRLRHSSAALALGDWRLVDAFERTIAYRRTLEGESVITIINDGDIEASLGDSAHELLWGDATVEGGRITVPPRSAAILR